MRSFKFRAFNTRRKEIEEITDLYWFEENSVHENGDNDYLILEYTGLIDANGVEICEGDLLNVPYNGLGTLEVKFENGKFNATNYNIARCKVVGKAYLNNL